MHHESERAALRPNLRPVHIDLATSEIVYLRDRVRSFSPPEPNAMVANLVAALESLAKSYEPRDIGVGPLEIVFSFSELDCIEKAVSADPADPDPFTIDLHTALDAALAEGWRRED